jgi:Tol biopolymer transport system component
VQELYVVPVAGGPEQPLTADGRSMNGHAWLPDGRALLVSSNRDGAFALWQVAAGAAPTRVAGPWWNPGKPVLSRDGQRLAFQQASVDVNLWRLDVSPARDTAAAPVRLIASTYWDLHPAIAPDGARVDFTSSRSGHHEIWTAAADGSAPLQLTRFAGPFVGTPRWSPDGRTLAFDVRHEGQADLYTVDAEGGPPRRLTADVSDELAASWSRDGRSLYFASNRAGPWQVWKMPAAGGVAVRVTAHGGFAAHESPDGQFLYYTKGNAPGLWRAPLAGAALGEEGVVLPGLLVEDWGSWSVHDDGLFFVTRGPLTVSFYDFAARRTDVLYRPPRRVPLLDPSLAVSPDGRWLLFGQVDHSESDVMYAELPAP